VQLSIQLGPDWQRFSPPHADLKLLGTVQHEAAIGALARDAEGVYWQVNGDHRRKLNTSRVNAALRKAKRRGPAPHTPVQRAPAPPPQIIIKRRRVVVMP
jgi:hypothetical protein